MDATISSSRATSPFASIASLPGVIAVAAVYGLVHATLRYAASPTIGIDDGTAAVFSQDWALGYVAKNPPLYDWLLKSVQTVVGPNLVAALILKYALLTAAAAFTYLASQRVVDDRRWAALTAFSLSLCYQIGWNFHEGMTHTAVLLPLIMATLWCVFRLMERGTIANNVALGVCLGLGLIAKYNFVVFCFGVAVASAFVPAARVRFTSPRIVLTLIPMLVIAAPHAYWLMHQDGPAFVRQSADPNARLLAKRVLVAFVSLVKSPFGFLVPLAVLLPLLFPGFLHRLAIGVRSFGARGLANEAQRVLLIFTLVSLAIVFASVLVFGNASARVRYMHPFFLPTMLLLTALAKDECQHPRQMRWFAMALAAMCAVVVAIRVTNLYVGPPYCGRCHPLERFEPLAAALKTVGANSGAIVTDDQFIAGNVRRLLRASPVALVSPAVTYVPPRWQGAARDQVTVVLRSGSDDAARVEALLSRALSLEQKLETTAHTERVEGHWTAPLGERPLKSTWTIATFRLSELGLNEDAAPGRLQN